MLDLKYIKEYSFRNKNSSTNKDVIDKLNQLDNKTQNKNAMRVNVFKQVTMEFPYSFKIIQKDINDDAALIRIEVTVELLKLIILFTITSIAVASLLIMLVQTYLVILPIVLFTFLFYYLSRQQVLSFTIKLVEGWFNKDSL